MGKDIGIDLGASTISVFIKGQGIVLREPSIVAVDKNTGNIVKIGQEAKLIIGRTPGNIAVLRPLRSGINIQYDTLTKMLAFFMKKACGSLTFKPRAVICVPSGISEGEERAIIDAAIAAGAKKTYLIDETISAALGAGLDISLPSGNMVINIGSNITDIDVISLNKVIVSESLKIAGDSFDEAVITYIRNNYDVVVDEETAEEIKKTIGTVWLSDDMKQMNIHGTGYYDGLPKTICITSDEMIEALSIPADMIAEAAAAVIERTPPELFADIERNGIVLTGGGSMLSGLSRVISEVTGIKTRLADNPSVCAVLGVGYSLERISELPEGSVRMIKRS
ncbi:MAG: rod shape-determining protein MreB [Eubacteriales bacterium]